MILRRSLIAFCLTLNLAQANEAPVLIERYVLVAGANDGGADRLKLRYANSDARAVARVFEDIGGVERKRLRILEDPSPEQLLAAIKEFNDKISTRRTPGIRSELFFYYSGHSDEYGLLLREQQLNYKTLREALLGVQTDIHVAILDSCASGAFTRTKGGRKKPPFLVDASNKVKGHAFLTSSSADEAAQESDAIGGSFFTHYFITALRGAADSSRDKKISLNEAYQFAFHETLARTEQSVAGAQHAAYDIQLVGAGDLVLTDISNTEASLTISDNVKGRLFIRGGNNQLVAELNKTSNKPVQLALEPDNYHITIQQDDRSLRSQKSLRRHEHLLLADADLEEFLREETVSRGPLEQSIDSEIDRIQTLMSDKQFTDIRFRFAYGTDSAYYSNNIDDVNKTRLQFDFQLLPNPAKLVDGLSAGLFLDLVDTGLNGAQLSLFGNINKGFMNGAQASYGFNWNRGLVNGMQASTFINFNEDRMHGLQAAGIANVSERLRGMQTAGIVNVSKNQTEGMQVAGITNIGLGRGRGFQVAGLVNYARQEFRGLQVSGVYNHLIYGRAAQIGTVNYAVELDGAQIGVVNWTESLDGVAIGLVNRANDITGITLGPVNIIKGGRRNVGFSHDQHNFSNVYYKSGGKNWYNRIGYFGDKNISQGFFGWGFGAYWPFSKLVAIDGDISTLSWSDISGIDLDTGDIQYKSGCQSCIPVDVLIQINTNIIATLKYINILAGLSINVLQYDPSRSERYAHIPHLALNKQADMHEKTWMSFNLGLEF